MALYAMADNDVAITAQRDAVLYNAVLGNQDVVFNGVGNSLSCTVSNLVVTLQSGEGVVQGRHITCVGTENLQVDANSSGYIVLRYDLTQAAGNEVSLKAVPLVVQNDLNNDGTIRDLKLYSYSSSATAVTLVDERNLMTSTNDNLGTQVTYTLSGTSLYINTL